MVLTMLLTLPGPDVSQMNLAALPVL
jgi:hypothetical protein